MEQRRELFPLLLACDLSHTEHAAQRAGPALRPGRGRVLVVLLGRSPPPPALRRGIAAVVRALRWCRVGGGAAHVADLRPPLKLHMQFSRMQLSRKRGAGPRRQRRDQTNQAYQPQLAPEARRREHLPSRTAPPAKAVRPQPSLHPSIELVKE